MRLRGCALVLSNLETAKWNRMVIKRGLSAGGESEIESGSDRETIKVYKGDFSGLQFLGGGIFTKLAVRDKNNALKLFNTTKQKHSLKLHDIAAVVIFFIEKTVKTKFNISIDNIHIS